MAKRPNLSSYFRAQIDQHVRGMLATTYPRLPSDVTSVRGRVTDRIIVVTMRDGSTFTYRGGRYATRKVNGCYAPLMPTPIA